MKDKLLKSFLLKLTIVSINIDSFCPLTLKVYFCVQKKKTQAVCDIRGGEAGSK